MLQSLHLVRLPLPFLSPLSPLQPQPISLSSLPKPTSTLFLSALPRARTGPWLAEVPDGPEPHTAQDGPVELPPSAPSIFATSDGPSQLQVATSVLLTGAISVFLFRSLRRRAKRVKESKFRSSEAKKSMKEDAIESLKAMTPVSPGAKGPPSPVQALLGGISAGVIALILYKFTTTIEGSLNRQALSDNFSVRQITITIRTIVNGLCYLATSVFGINSVGLILYSGQLALSSIMGDSSSEKVIESSQMGSNATTNSLEDSSDADASNEDQSPDGK